MTTTYDSEGRRWEKHTGFMAQHERALDLAGVIDWPLPVCYRGWRIESRLGAIGDWPDTPYVERFRGDHIQADWQSEVDGE